MIKQSKTKQKITGENIIINGSRVSFLYTIPSFSYSSKNDEDVEAHVDKLYSMVEALNNKTPDLRFCLSNMQIPLTVKELRDDLVENIRKWKPEFREPELKFINRIKTGCYTLFILEIFSDTSKDNDVGILDTVKGIVNSIENVISNSVDMEPIFKKEKGYENILRNFGCGRTTQYITFRYLLGTYFPGVYFHNTDFSEIKYNTVVQSVLRDV